MSLAAFSCLYLVALLSCGTQADTTSHPSGDCGEACPAADAVDPVLLQLSAKPSRHDDRAHGRKGEAAELEARGGAVEGKVRPQICCQQMGFAAVCMSQCRNPKIEVSGRLCNFKCPGLERRGQACPVADSAARKKIVDEGKRLIGDMGYCPSWENMKRDYKLKMFPKSAFGPSLRYNEAILQAWSALRDPMLKLGFECANEITKNAEYKLNVPPASTADPTSDIDATCSGKNPSAHISHTLVFMAEVLGELGCETSWGSAESVVAYYLDTNIYGNLVDLDERTYEEMNWPASTQALFQKGEESKAGRQVFYLKRVCDQAVMDAEIDGRINQFADEIAAKPCDSHPIEVRINQWQYETDLNEFWTALEMGNKYSDTDAGWAKLFRDLGQIMANQRESYLTYAGTFDVVMDRASGLRLSASDIASKQCIEHVASRDSITFLLEHIYHDGIGMDDRTKLRYLVEVSKYWDRLYDSVFPIGNTACVALRKGSAAIKKCGPCIQKQSGIELKCGLEVGATSQTLCPNTPPEEGSCVITAEDEKKSCKTYRAIGREVTESPLAWTQKAANNPPKLLQYLADFDQCLGTSELSGVGSVCPDGSPAPPDVGFRKSLFDKLRQFGVGSR